MVRAKEFVQGDAVEISAGVCPHVLADITVARTFVDEMVGGPVPEAARARVGFGGEVRSVASGIIGCEGVAGCQSHGGTSGASRDLDIIR